MAVHNKKDWGKPVDHPDNYGAYVTNEKGEVTYRNNGYSPGAMGGKTDATATDSSKKSAGSSNIGQQIQSFFQNFRQSSLFAQVPQGAEVPKATRGRISANPVHDSHERRVKLSLPGGLKRFYQNDDENDFLLDPLIQSRGIIFPYTPQIIMNNTANYSQRAPVHTNYPYQIYQNSQVSTINLLVQFTAQNATEARYVLACIMFLRLVTKSFRGDDIMAGSPPPVLRLSGHGTNLLPQVPVVVQDFALTLPNNVDYITITDNKYQDESRRLALRSMDKAGAQLRLDRVPTVTDISVTMMPVYSREQITNYNIKDIVTGRNLGINPEGFI